MKPWIQRRKVENAIDVLNSGDKNWEYLDGEERHGTVVQALEILEESNE